MKKNNGGEATIVFSDKQMEAFTLLTDKKTRSIGYGGGARGGKTWLGCVWVYLMCLRYPGTSWFLGRKTLVDLHRTTVLEFLQIKTQYFGNSCNLYGKSEIRFTNGSRILLLDLAYQPSDPHASSLDGLVLQGGLIDEANEVDSRVIATLYTRVMADNRYPALFPKILETFNPDKGRVYEKFYKPYRDKCERDDTKFIPALAKDNPYCPKGYVEAILASGDELAIQRKVYGNFDYDDDATKILKYNEILDLFTNVGVSDGKHYMSIDVAAGGDDTTVIVVWNGYTVVECLQFKSRENNIVENTITALKSKYNIPKSNIIIDAIGVGFGLAKDYGTAFIGSSSGGVGYKNLRAKCFLAIAKHKDKISLNGIPTSFREKVIQELSILQIVDNGGVYAVLAKEKMKEIIGRSPDFLDAISMRFYFEDDKKALAWKII